MKAWVTKMKFGWVLATGVAGLLIGGAVASAQETLPAGDVEAGAEVYAAQCKGCHTVSIAPTLRGVADRRIAGVSTFAGYSDGLKAKAGETWTAANLDAFLAAPATFAPGTRMVMAMPDPQIRADVIAYIRSLPPPRDSR